MASTSSDGVLHFKRKQMFSRKFFTFPLEDGLYYFMLTIKLRMIDWKERKHCSLSRWEEKSKHHAHFSLFVNRRERLGRIIRFFSIAGALLISNLDSGRVNKVNAITKFNDFNAQDVFFGISSNSSGDKLKIIEMKFREPEMEIKHIHTVGRSISRWRSQSSIQDRRINSSGRLWFLSILHSSERGESTASLQIRWKYEEIGRKESRNGVFWSERFLRVQVSEEERRTQKNKIDTFLRNYIYCLYHDSVSDTSTIDRYDIEHGRVESILKTEKTVNPFITEDSESKDFSACETSCSINIRRGYWFYRIALFS